jgi:hypothetical protein
MLSKKLSKLILIGGIGAFINSVVFTFLFNKAYDVYFGPIFYFVHSFVTILAGYFLLKRSKLGVIFLITSFVLFVLALFIPAPFLNLHDYKGQIENTSLFSYTILVSITVVVLVIFFFVPIFTAIFLFSVGKGTIIIFKKYISKKVKKNYR